MTSNALLTPALITKETLVILENNLVMAGKVNRQFENQFVKIGNAVTIRKPNRFIVTRGPGLVIQNISEPSTSLTISNQVHVDFQFSSQDLTLTVPAGSPNAVWTVTLPTRRGIFRPCVRQRS